MSIEAGWLTTTGMAITSGSLADAIAKCGYRSSAVELVAKAVWLAVHTLHGPPSPEDQPGDREVSAAQLCQAMESIVLNQYGFLATTVLRLAGLETSADLGRVLEALDLDALGRAEVKDTFSDFIGLADFADLERTYRVEL